MPEKAILSRSDKNFASIGRNFFLFFFFLFYDDIEPNRGFIKASASLHSRPHPKYNIVFALTLWGQGCPALNMREILDEKKAKKAKLSKKKYDARSTERVTRIFLNLQRHLFKSTTPSFWSHNASL